jgi:diacylglycerol kinase (ATP)
VTSARHATGGEPATGSGQAAPRRRYRVIRNPNAGIASQLSGNNEADDLRELLNRHGIDAEVLEPGDEEGARAAARQAVADGVDVVAAGGDGTIHVVAEALIGTDRALGILPMGRVMNVARSLGIERDLEVAAEVLVAGEVRAIDVGEAVTADGRVFTFLEAGSVGLNAAIFREVTRADAGEAGSILRTIWVAIRYRPARMRLELDDDVIPTRALMASLSIGPYLGLGMTVAPAARLDDGLFDVRVFRRYSKGELLRYLASIAFGRRRYAPQVSTYRSATVGVTSAHPLPARADSYDLGHTPVVFHTRPGALRVIVPAGGPGGDGDAEPTTNEPRKTQRQST